MCWSLWRSKRTTSAAWGDGALGARRGCGVAERFVAGNAELFAVRGNVGDGDAVAEPVAGVVGGGSESVDPIGFSSNVVRARSRTRTVMVSCCRWVRARSSAVVDSASSVDGDGAAGIQPWRMPSPGARPVS